MKKFLVLGCSFFWLSVATAEIPKYRYLDLAYVDSNLEVELDDAKEDVDQEGYEIEASYGFFDNRLLLVGSYTDVSGDLGPVDVDLDTIDLRVGSAVPIGESTVMDISATWRKDKFELRDFGSDSVNGLGVNVGLRSNVTSWLELFGRVNGFFQGDYETGVAAELGGMFNITDWFGISASYEYVAFDVEDFDVTISQGQIGARFQF